MDRVEAGMSAPNGSEPPRSLRVTEPEKGYTPHGWKEEDSEVFVVQPTGELTPVPRERACPRREKPDVDPLADLRTQVRVRTQARNESERLPETVTMWVGGATVVSLFFLVMIALWIAL